MYLAVVTREMVDSCRPSSSAISRSTSGFIAISPCVKKLFCRSTMACDTRRMVSKRCWMFLMNQRASCSRALRPAARRSPAWPRAAADRLRVEVVDAQLGHHVGVEHAPSSRGRLLHDHVGHDDVRLGALNGRARLGLAARRSAPAPRAAASSSAPVAAISCLKSRRASSSRWLLADDASRSSAPRSAAGRAAAASGIRPGRARRRRPAPGSAASCSAHCRRCEQLVARRRRRRRSAGSASALRRSPPAYRPGSRPRSSDSISTITAPRESSGAGACRASWPRRWSCSDVRGAVAVAFRRSSSPSLTGARHAAASRGCRRSRRARCRSPSRRARSCRIRCRRSPCGSSPPSKPASAARSVSRFGRRARRSRRPLRRIGVDRPALVSSSASRNGFCSSICSTSWCSSSVDSCSSRIDCCSCGVSARCCDRRTCSEGFMRHGGRETDSLLHVTSGSVRRGRRLRTSAFSTISLRRAFGQHAALADDVGAVADAQRLAHVVVGDQHADAAAASGSR